MNKYTKNIIFFNLEKIIALTTVITIVILTISLLSSCTSTSHVYDTKLTPHSTYECPTFKNSRI